MNPLNENSTRLLASQKRWMLSGETERMLMGGWRAGKTRILCQTGILLSYLIPDNLGFIGRASGKDLHSTTIQTFLDEVCPPELLVGKPRKIGQSGLEVTLKTRYPGLTSKVYFDYIIDRQTGRSHLAGGNWGWFGVDQVEEIMRGDWHKLMGRLSRTYYDPETKTRKPIKYHALGAGNQMGHDWIFEDFYQGGDYIFNPQQEPKTFYKAVSRKGRLGIIVRSEENAMSNGGFVPDEYFANLRRTMPRQWQARYMDGSFDDFTGKIYGDYNLDSVHNIEPFQIPAHWPWYVSIDPGGSAPWGIGVWRVDEFGNKILMNSADELYDKSRLSPNEVIKWLKATVPVERSRNIIDYQNIPIMQLFQEEGIHCEPAMKDRAVGINGAIAEFYVQPDVKLPTWYLATQPKERIARFKDKGAPRVFNFNTCRTWMKEHDNWVWDLVKKNEPKASLRDDHCDETRYLLAAKPQPALGKTIDQFGNLRYTDPTTAAHLDDVSKEIARWKLQRTRAAQWNQDPCDGGQPEDGSPTFIADYY